MRHYKFAPDSVNKQRVCLLFLSPQVSVKKFLTTIRSTRAFIHLNSLKSILYILDIGISEVQPCLDHYRGMSIKVRPEVVAISPDSNLVRLNSTRNITSPCGAKGTLMLDKNKLLE